MNTSISQTPQYNSVTNEVENACKPPVFGHVWVWDIINTDTKVSPPDTGILSVGIMLEIQLFLYVQITFSVFYLLVSFRTMFSRL